MIAAAALYAALLASIVVLADLGETETGRIIDRVRSVPHGDHIAHFVLMGSLALLVNLAIGPRRVTRLAIPLGTAIVAVIVTLEEISQLWMHHRTFDPVDLAADFLGIGLATAITLAIERRAQRGVNRTT